MQILIALVSGLLFGSGLILSGMTDPSKVLAFLDISGRWDPSLALVMGGAILVMLPVFRLATRLQRSLLGTPIGQPVGGRIDRRLLLGGLLFGIGWGVAGFCPGPALTSLLTGGHQVAWFVLAMLAGMGLFEIAQRWPTADPASH